ncbi:MAG: phage tail sheath subtilisin-like domain-containing protein [Chloroflexota bacterium]
MNTHYSLPGIYTEDVFITPRPPLQTGVPIFLAYMPNVPDSVLGFDAAFDTADMDARRLAYYQTPIEIVSEYLFGQLLAHLPADTYTRSAVNGFLRNGGVACYVLPLPELTQEAVVNALQVLEDFGEGDLLCIPDVMLGLETQSLTAQDVILIQRELLTHCAKVSTRFAILDALPEREMLLEQREILIQAAGRYGAIYFPWIMTLQETTRFVPPSGHIAGTYARSDIARGIHKAPANEELEDVLDIKGTITKREQVALMAQHINYILPMRGRGIRAWGAHTLSTDAQWRFLTTSRLFAKVSRWVHRFMTTVAFENNDIYLWTYIESTLMLYLFDLVEAGEIKGYFVRCNAETNPPDARELGVVRTQIGLAPAYPLEYIVVRVLHGEGGTTIDVE